jgi:hypothetical protein
MKFYRFTHPEYVTDQMQSSENPIRMSTELYVPGIICPGCADVTGGGWASSDRVRVAVPRQSALWPYLTGKSLGIPEWFSTAERIRTELAVPPWQPVTPGAQLGLPKGELTATRVPAVLHPFPGQVIVREEVIEAIEKAGLSGIDVVGVEVRWGNRIQGEGIDLPHLYELVVKGQGWRKGSDQASITVCAECQRTIFPNPDHLVVDEGRWDSSDFFHVDKNPNIVLVTERVCRMFTEQGFGNWRCLPVL